MVIDRWNPLNKPPIDVELAYDRMWRKEMGLVPARKAPPKARVKPKRAVPKVSKRAARKAMLQARKEKWAELDRLGRERREFAQAYRAERKAEAAALAIAKRLNNLTKGA